MNVYDSLDAIGADPAPVKKAAIPFRFPPSTDDLDARGLVKRVIEKRPGETALHAVARARSLKWWRAVASPRPYSTARYWIFLVDRTVACS